MNKYSVEIMYQKRTSWTTKYASVDVYAKTHVEARRLGKEWFVAERFAPSGTIIKTTAKRVVEPFNDEQNAMVGNIYSALTNLQFKVCAAFTTSNGIERIAIEWLTSGNVETITRTRFLQLTTPRETIEYWTVYPNGNVYKQNQPLRNSMYDFEDLVRLKITKLNGKIVNKEFL